jgi:RNA polymerase sigma-70 factor (ECF subfamily)
MPDESEALALHALLLDAESRRPPRTDADGRFVPLGDQDPVLWNSRLIDEAEAARDRA